MKNESIKDNALTSSNKSPNGYNANGRFFENSDLFLNNRTNNGTALRTIGSGKATHNQPRKDLNENIKHGTSVFPFAAYIWEPQNFSSRVTLHWHKEVELVRFSKGKFKISVDMHDLVIEDDAFLLLPGNIMHTFDLPPHCEESAIVFDPKMLIMSHYDEVQSELFDALLSSNIPIPPLITPDHPAFSRIDKLYRYCARHGATKNASHRLLIKAKLLEIIALYHEYGLLSRKEASKNILPSKQDKLKDLLNYIDSHFAGPMTIRDASLRLGVTDQYFCRYFKKVTGMSFTEYLGDLRLRRAAKDIELTTRAISDIAFENGFENTGYFFKSFKAKFGVTPLRYRKRYIEESTALASENNDHNNGDCNPTLSPIDIDHTSAAYNSDMNVNKTTPSERSNSEHHTKQGTIAFKYRHTSDKVANTSVPSTEETSSDLKVNTKSTLTNNGNKITSPLATASLFEDDDEYDLRHQNINKTINIQDNNTSHNLDYSEDIDANIDNPIDSKEVKSHLKTSEDISQALKRHAISHLDALDNEEDLFEDEWDESLYPNGLNSKIAPHKLKNHNNDNSDELEGSSLVVNSNFAKKENTTAKKTVFALQERFNLNDLGNGNAKKAKNKLEDKAKISKNKVESKVGSSEEEFWFDDQGNLRSKVHKKTAKPINEADENTSNSKNNATQSTKLNLKTGESKTKTRSEIRDKIAELERKRHDPFGL